MSIIRTQALIAELRKRDLAQERKQFRFSEFAFEKQKEFFVAPGPRFRVADTSRRSGKTTGIIGDLLRVCMETPGATCLYITLTRENVRKILWQELTMIIREYEIDCKLDNLALEVKFPNGSRILTGGVKDRTEIEKFRGFKLTRVYLDECQSMRSYIKELIDDVLIPALRDLRGSLFMTGTPGAVKAGSFWEYCNNPNWFHLKWTAFDNPYMHDLSKGKDLEVTLAEERKLRGIDVNDASYQRETYGVWIEDTESLVVRYDENINHYNDLPRGQYEYVLGVDVGYEDSDAIAVLAYSYNLNKIYVVEEYENPKQDITELANKIKLYQRKYKPVKMIMDAGALGKKIQEEFLKRHSIPIEAADKHRKLEYLEFMNADLRKQVLYAKKDSLFAQDSKLVTWDRSDPANPKISKAYHSDILDAVLYAYRCCLHYIKTEVEAKQKVGTDEYMDELEERDAENSTRMREDPDLYQLEQDMEQDMEEMSIMDDFGY